MTPGPRNAANVGGHHDQVASGYALRRQVVEYDRVAIHMVHRDVKVPHTLPRMQIHGKDPRRASLRQQVGGQLRCNCPVV